MSTPPPTADPVTADPQQLPDDPALLKAMLAEVLRALRDSRREGEQLRARLDQLLRRLYGPRAERLDPNQPLLFPEPPTPPAPAPAPTAEAAPAAVSNGRRGHGRRALPAHLPRDRQVYELTAAERACPCCGGLRQVIGQEVSEQLDYVPASLRVIEHVRLTYACAACAAARPAESPAPPAAAAAPPRPPITTAANPAQGCWPT
jgi:transposase